MLIKEFYKIISLSSDDSGINATIKLNPNHEVYKGHFPEQPLVPGVIQLQIIKELLERDDKSKLFMNNIIQVKYLTPVVPANHPVLIVHLFVRKIDEKSVRIDASISTKNIVFTKAKLEFTIL